MASAHPPNGVVEDEGKAKAFGLVEALLFTTLKTAVMGVKSCPAKKHIPTIIIEEQGAIGTLTEWQNLYPRREIMVLGMGLKEGGGASSGVRNV
jgi:hypothetical protein